MSRAVKQAECATLADRTGVAGRVGNHKASYRTPQGCEVATELFRSDTGDVEHITLSVPVELALVQRECEQLWPHGRLRRRSQ